MTPEEIRTLFDYNAWANHRSLEAAAALPNEQFTKALVSSFSSVRDTLAHICGAELVWYERFRGNSPSTLPDLSSLSTIEALRTHWSAQEAKLLGIRRGADAVRPRPRHGIQDPKIRRLQQPAVAIHAASGESRHLPSRTSHHAAASAWREGPCN